MANIYYNPTGNPGTGSEGLSSVVRAEFALIGVAFNLVPQISTTGSFATVFNQVGNYTFTLPAAPGTLATTANVSAETTRATTAEALLAPKASPAFTGVPTAPTASPGVNTTQIGTTAFVTAAVGVETARATTAEGGLAPIASPVLTGTPQAPLASPGTNTNQIATTAFVAAAAALLAPKASPLLTGTPLAPTAAPGTNTTQIATTAFTTAAVAVETTRATAAELVALGGIGRNRLHNGGFGINQRAQVSGAALAAGAYGHDRWKAGAGGCTYTFTQIQPTTVITITAGTLQQVVESLTVEGGTYTLSWSGSATARINSGSYLASPITVSGLSANTAITVEFNTGTVDSAQLEPGSTATVFARRSYRYELAECQRFYQTGNFGLQGYTSAVAVTVGYEQTLPVVMRAAPTVVVASETAATGMSTRSIIADDSGHIRPAGLSGANGGFAWVGVFTATADL